MNYDGIARIELISIPAFHLNNNRKFVRLAFQKQNFRLNHFIDSIFVKKLSRSFLLSQINLILFFILIKRRFK